MWLALVVCVGWRVMERRWWVVVRMVSYFWEGTKNNEILILDSNGALAGFYDIGENDRGSLCAVCYLLLCCVGDDVGCSTCGAKNQRSGRDGR